MKNRLLGMLAILVTSASPLFGDVSGSSVLGTVNIPDNGSATSIVTITENQIIQDAEFTISGLQHSWIGDLVITVENLATGTQATLVERVGQEVGAPLGDSSDVNGTYTFATQGSVIWTEAANGDADFVVTPGTYQATGAGEVPVDLSTLFAGQSTQGDWLFTVSDADGSGFQTGSFTQTSVNFTAVPEPGTMATIVVGTMLGGFYFRRRHLRAKA